MKTWRRAARSALASSAPTCPKRISRKSVSEPAANLSANHISGRKAMKVAIIGAGAIGGYVGVKLALAGEDVTFIVRGANLSAIRRNGMKLIMADGSEHVAAGVRATNDYTEAGPQDLVILAMKAHQVEAVAGDLPKLFGPDTAVVTMQNGIPYWYFHKHGGPLEGCQVHSVDPGGMLTEQIPPRRVIGCVVYPASE